VFRASASRARKYLLRIIVIISPVFYIILWNLIIRYDLLSIIKIPFRYLTTTFFQTWAEVRVGAHPEAVVWRMRFIPVYWSKVGNLMPYHTLFSVAYIFYIAVTFLNVGRMGMSFKNKITSINFNTVKKFWLIFGVIAFLTTSLSTVAILSDLFALIYYFAYLISLPMVPISVYIWYNRSKSQKK
jgi:hypothetical protein